MMRQLVDYQLDRRFESIRHAIENLEAKLATV
jgi:hypothetical protein